MNIAIDIDDTLTESFDYFLPFVAEYFGAEEEELRDKNISYSTLPDQWKKDEIALHDDRAGKTIIMNTMSLLLIISNSSEPRG